MWYAITMFRNYLALAVEEEFYGYRVIDPQVRHHDELSKFRN